MRSKIGMGIVGLGLCLGGCGKSGGSAGAGPSKPVDLGKTGYVIDVPGWTVEENMESWFSFKDGRRSLGTVRVAVEPPPADATALGASLCAGQEHVVAEAIPGGGMFATCSGPSEATVNGQPIVTTKVEVHRPGPGGKDFVCAWETDSPDSAAAVLAACKTIRQK